MDVPKAVVLRTTAQSGTAPLEAYFYVASTLENPMFIEYRMDFEGDGVIDYTGADFENISHIFTSEGIYYPNLTVTDITGNVYSDTLAIAVLPLTDLDKHLKGIWEGMKEALALKDVDSALSNFLSASQERYQYIFANLLSLLPEIVAGMQDIELVALEDDVAEYRIKRLEDVGLVTYYIYFVRDEYGIWKIEQF